MMMHVQERSISLHEPKTRLQRGMEPSYFWLIAISRRRLNIGMNSYQHSGALPFSFLLPKLSIFIFQQARILYKRYLEVTEKLVNFESSTSVLRVSSIYRGTPGNKNVIESTWDSSFNVSQQDIELILVANSSKSIPVLHAHARTFPGSESDVFDIDVIDKGTVLFHTMAIIEGERERGTRTYVFRA